MVKNDQAWGQAELSFRKTFHIPDSAPRQSIRKQNLKARQCLFHQGDASIGVYIVLSGALKAFKVDQDGNELIVSFYYPGDILWTSDLTTDVNVMTVSALTPASISVIPIQTLQKQMADKQVRQTCYELLSKTIRQEQRFACILAKGTAEQRLCYFLFDTWQRQNPLSCNVNLPMSQQDIANYLGLSKETVSRVFSKLNCEGLLKLSGRRVQLSDVLRLSTMIPGKPAASVAQVSSAKSFEVVPLQYTDRPPESRLTSPEKQAVSPG